MKRFIKELRRREVFRTAGLYVGICWISIEVGSVVLPVFDAPEWIFRGAIVAAVAGFPVMLVLAWFFDVSESGISLQGDPTDTIVEQLGAHKSDFVVIGVLVLALAVSLFLNVQGSAPVATATQPVSVQIADIENTTGDPIFENVLQEALLVGVEVAPHVVVFDSDVEQPAGKKNIALMRLVGSLQPSGNGYRITVEGFDVSANQEMFTIDEKADSRDAVLKAIGDLVIDARKELGDEPVGDSESTQAQTFVAASLESASAYVAGKRYEAAGEIDKAANSYRDAAASDPNSGRTLASLALLEFDRGNTDAAAYWSQALPLLETMTERERLRALGRYNTTAVVDEDAALTLYSEFVDKYPADIGARENLAAVAFRRLDFKTAIEQSQSIVALLPQSTAHRSQLALYAMAAGDWDMASAEAEQVIATDPSETTAWSSLAMTALAQGQINVARDTYEKMSTADEKGRGASIANLGLADIDLFVGDVDAAREHLQASIEADITNGDRRMAALKTVAIAESHAYQQDFQAATETAAAAVALSEELATQVLAAMVYVSADELASVQTTIDALAEQPGTHSQAYAKLLRGLVLEREGAQTDAIQSMRAAISTADLWLIRFEIGKAYLRAGNYPEALGEFTTLKNRSGEAASAFLDAMPTYRLLAELPYWTGRVQEELKMHAPARASYEEYAALRTGGDALADDARERMARLD